MSQKKAACCSLFLAFASDNALQSCMQSMLSGAPEQGKVKLLDQVREAIRLKHYSLRTEQTYLDWIKRFILFHGKRHPKAMGAEEVRQFLTHLAREGRVAASTQNQHVKASLTCGEQV